MSFHIFKIGDGGKKFYLTDIPHDENPLGGYGYQSMADGSVPADAGTCPSEEAAIKLCDHLKTAFYGPEEEHFFEMA